MTLLLITIIILDTLTEAATGFTSKISNISLNPDYATKYDASVNSSKERIVHPVWNEEHPKLEVNLVKQCLLRRWTMTLWVSHYLRHKEKQY